MEFAFLSPSPMELAVIAVLALIVLGPARLPEAARSLGKGMREMRDSFQSATGDDDLKLPEEDDSPEHPLEAASVAAEPVQAAPDEAEQAEAEPVPPR